MTSLQELHRQRNVAAVEVKREVNAPRDSFVV
jgi:hypothetical protein